MPTTSKRRATILDAPLRLDHVSGNQALQVYAGSRGAILEGRLAAGLRLPSTRGLADQLRVNRNAVVIAYEHLQSDGLADARTGSGTFVASLPPPTHRAPPATTALDFNDPPPNRPFALGSTIADPQMLRHLAAATRRHIIRGEDSEFGYGDPRGDKALREQIARYLAAIRCGRASLHNTVPRSMASMPAAAGPFDEPGR